MDPCQAGLLALRVLLRSSEITVPLSLSCFRPFRSQDQCAKRQDSMLKVVYAKNIQKTNQLDSFLLKK